MKVYLNDERKTPDGWVRVYWPDEAIELLKTGCVADISLDHDLGDDERGTGYDVVLWCCGLRKKYLQKALYLQILKSIQPIHQHEKRWSLV